MREFDPAEQTHRRTPPTGSRATEAGATTAVGGGAERGAPLTPAAILGLQRTVGNASVVQLLAADEEPESPVHDVVGGGGGAPLDEGVRTAMESRFGQDFSDVRVHTDAKASASAESVGANAYTVGSDIVFKSGQFDTSSAVGQRTLAHELTHVVQQRSGPVDGTEAAGGIRLSDPADRFEQAAEATAAAVMAGPAPASAPSADAAAVQRDEEQADGAAFVQRQAETEEEEEPALG